MRTQLSPSLFILVAVMVSLTIGGCSDDAGAPSDGAIVPGDGLTTHDSTAPQDGLGDSEWTPDTGLPTDGGTACATQAGGATLSGSVNGQALSATLSSAVEGRLMGLIGYGVGLWDNPSSGSCGALWSAPTSNQAVIAIQICDHASGTYVVGENCLQGGSGISVKNSVAIPRPDTDIKAGSGAIVIDTFDPACGGSVKGTFSADFSGEAVSGTFETTSCGVIDL